MNFNIRLKECRNERGWTQEGISKILGIKRPRYAKYETGENEPDYATLIKLADLFGVSTDYLLGIENGDYINEYTNAIEELSSIDNLLQEISINTREIFDIEKWSYLNQNDIEEINNHFNWIVHKAKKRNIK